MSLRYDRSRPRQNSTRENNRLAFEQLEARLMNAIDTVDHNLELLTAPETVGATPVISAVTNSAPSVASPLRLTGSTQVSGRTASVSVLGKDDKGESNLRYSWQTVAQPTGGVVSFARTGTNVAKNNTLTFNKPGTYEVRVSIQDQEGLTSSSNLRFTVVQTFTKLRVTTPDGNAVNSGAAINTVGSTQRLTVVGLDQFESPMAVQPSVVWKTISTPTGGSATLTRTGNTVSATVSRLGTYVLSAQSGTKSFSVSMIVGQTLSSISVTANNVAVASNQAVTVIGSRQSLSMRGFDQFGKPMATLPSGSWSTISAPTNGSATNSLSGKDAEFTFNRAGTYVIRATSGGRAQNVTLNVVQTISSMTVTPGTTNVVAGGQQQYRVQTFDQFQQAMTSQPATTWSATGGTITSGGLFIAGTTAGNFVVTARSGVLSRTAAVQVTAPVPQALRNQALAELVTRLNEDSQLSRLEVIQILRSTGNDGTVDATELADIQFLVSNHSPFSMPSHVRELARDVVNGNVANSKFKGQAAGNLVAGSSSALLNNLVDKWFLGADEPALTTSSLTYQTVVGSLFSSTPSRADAKQGMLGDCYFIASLISIADKNPDAVRNMFIDNGDNTYTVRFYGGSLGSFYNNGLISAGFVSGTGVADYVTVNRRLPAYSNGTLGYSSYGMSIASLATPIWIALAEKAYAQWNEAGQSGRDGTNRYAAIEGGWMSNVNSQVLGYNSTNYSFNSSSKQSLVTALTSAKSVTLGTLQNATAGGLVGSHAYTVTGYNASTDTFTLHNPWGVSHPTPLSWSQLQANCSMFVVADPTGSVTINQASVRSGNSEALVGSWTIETPILASLNATSDARGLVATMDEPIVVAGDGALSQGLFDRPSTSDGLALTQDSTDEAAAGEHSLFGLDAGLVDIAMASIKLNGMAV